MIYGAFIKAFSSFLPTTTTFCHISTLKMALSFLSQCVLSLCLGVPLRSGKGLPFAVAVLPEVLKSTTPRLLCLSLTLG